LAFAGRLSERDARRLFEQGDVYRVGRDDERCARAPVRIAILGAGGVAQAKYLPAVALLASRWEPVSVAGVLTPEPDQAEKIRRAFGVPAYGVLDQLLGEELPDAAIVTASDPAHRELAEAALAAGLHVLVEKPLAQTAADGRAIVAAAERARRIAVTVCNKRYSPPYRAAFDWLRDRRIGSPRMATAKFTLGYAYGDLLRGGTIHMLDLLRFFLGDASQVSAVSAPGPGTNLAVNLVFDSGAVAALATSSTALSLHPWERLEVFGEQAWLEVDDQARAQLHPSELAPAERYEPVVPSTLVSDLEWGGYVPMLEDFLQAVRGSEMALTGPEDGVRALELVEAIERSAAAGGEPVRPAKD
jgi:predicted dehydrogenase